MKNHPEIPSRISNHQVLQYIQSGTINSRYLNDVKKLTELSDEIISSWLHLNVKTYRSYKSKKTELSADVQEHIVLLLALIKHGIELFGNSENFNTWLQTPNFFFDQQTPLTYLNTISGIKIVDDQLTAMEYGDNV